MLKWKDPRSDKAIAIDKGKQAESIFNTFSPSYTKSPNTADVRGYDTIISKSKKPNIPDPKKIMKKHLKGNWNFNFGRGKRTLGTTNPKKKEIRVSKHLKKKPKKFKKVLKHEIAHALHFEKRGKKRRVKPHGREWKFIARKLGLKNPSATREVEGLIKQKSFKVYCPKCGKIFSKGKSDAPPSKLYRMRKFRYAKCPDCLVKLKLRYKGKSYKFKG